MPPSLRQRASRDRVITAASFPPPPDLLEGTGLALERLASITCEHSDPLSLSRISSACQRLVRAKDDVLQVPTTCEPIVNKATDYL